MDILGNAENSRTPEQLENMRQTIGQGKCPFCGGLDQPEHPRNGFDKGLNKIITQGQYWRGWMNPFPYPHHQFHIVLATINHITHLEEISSEMWQEWGTMNQKLITTLNLPGGGLVMRFGDNAYNAGTLYHIHSHIQVPDLSGPTFTVFSKSPQNPNFDEKALRLLKKAFSR